MLIIYRLPGLVACMALVVYVCFVMLLLGSVPGVQLTLPGIAGIIPVSYTHLDVYKRQVLFCIPVVYLLMTMTII